MDLEKWIFSLKSESTATAELYSSSLKLFCRFSSMTPEEMLEDVDRVEEALMDFVREYPPTTARNVYYAVKNWLKFNKVDMKLKLSFKIDSKVAHEERVPSPAEVKKLIDYAPLKTKVMIALMAYAGVRPEVIGNRDGSDGLRLKDLPELSLYPEPKFLTTPARVVVRPSLSKVDHQYFSFLNEYACEIIETSLKKRRDLDPDSPLVGNKNGGFLKTPAVSASIRRVIRLCGFKFRPYTLRHFFDTYLLMAESAQIIPRDYRVFWMGHKGDVEAIYSTNKKRLPPELIEDMRNKYERASMFLLESSSASQKKEEPVAKQKVVTVDEVGKYLENGWVYVATLPDNKVIIARGESFRVQEGVRSFQ